MHALKICTCFVLSYYYSVLFNFLCVLILFQNTYTHLCFRSEHLQSGFVSVQNTCSQLCFSSEHLQSSLFQIKTLAISFVSDQKTCNHFCFRSKHLQSALFQIRTLAVTIVSDLISEHLQICFRPCCCPLDFAAPGLLYARHNIDSYT